MSYKHIAKIDGFATMDSSIQKQEIQMFPHFIDSKFVDCQKQVVLWQLDHYHYEIEFTGNFPKAIIMQDTCLEDAVVAFKNIH